MMNYLMYFIFIDELIINLHMLLIYLIFNYSFNFIYDIVVIFIGMKIKGLFFIAFF